MSKKLRNNAFFSTLSAQNKHIAFLPYGFIRHRNKESKGKLPLEIRTKMIKNKPREKDLHNKKVGNMPC